MPRGRSPGQVAPFSGVAQDYAPAAVPEGLFQQDQGGDRYQKGTWRRRRGMRRTDIDTLSDAISTILGFATPEGFHLIIVGGDTIVGTTGTGTQGTASGAVGYGEIEFGEDEYGE